MILDTYIPATIRSQSIIRLTEISDLLGIEAEWLMIKMFIESGLNPAAHNPNGDASGLIGFMPKTAIGLGTSVEKLRQMNFLKQLDFVYNYYKPYKGRMKSYFDVSIITFFPVALGKSDDWIFHSSDLSPEMVVKYNPTFDLNHDNAITVREYKMYELKKIPTLAMAYIKDIVFKQNNWVLATILLSAVLSVAYNFVKK